MDSFPDWSPDGNKIVSISGRDGNNEVYEIAADAGNLTRLTNNPADDRLPRGSPKVRYMVNNSFVGYTGQRRW